MTTLTESGPPNDLSALWHAIGRIEEGQSQLSERMDRMEQSFVQRMDRMEQSFEQRMDRMDRLDARMDRLEKRMERLLYAGVAVGGAILAAVIVGQILG